MLRVHVIAVQRKKLHVTLLEGVISLSIHVERLVQTFDVGIVVVPQRGIELDARVQQRLVWHFKLLRKITRIVPAVNIVAKHDHEIEADRLPVCFHLFCDFVLLFISGPTVANHGQTH